jgi:NTE family protein
VAFPRDLALYVDDRGEPVDAESFPVYKAVRISAGYPYFFPPLGGLRDRHTNKQGAFADGGVGSAFPLYIFDKRQPKHPTWGFHLHGGRDASETDPTYHAIGGVGWPVQMLEAILDTSMNALDRSEQDRFRGRVIAIPTGGVSTLNFDLSPSEKEQLFKAGLDAATSFFENPPAPPENSYGRTP